MPETQTPTQYAILQMPDVQRMIEQASAAQNHLLKEIWSLQANPRPDGHEAADAYGVGFASVIVDETVPPYTIVYRVDDDQKRVVVIAIYEKRWS
jgi:hypothetical protein